VKDHNYNTEMREDKIYDQYIIDFKEMSLSLKEYQENPDRPIINDIHLTVVFEKNVEPCHDKLPAMRIHV
jgi:hypothetical protein